MASSTAAHSVKLSIFTAQGFNERLGFTTGESNRVTKWLVLEEGRYFKNTPKAVAALVARTVVTVFSAIACIFQGIASGLKKMCCCCSNKKVPTPTGSPEKGENPDKTHKPMIPIVPTTNTTPPTQETGGRVQSKSPDPNQQTPRSAGDFVNVNEPEASE